MSGGAAAASQGAPVLLTRPTSLPPTTRTALQRLAPAKHVVLGGTAVIAGAVVTELKGLLPEGVTVVRYGGADRYATSVAIADATWPSGASTVLYSSGLGFADALAGVPAAAVNGAPLLHAGASCLSSHVADTTADFTPDRQVMLRGTSALPATAMTPCGAKGSALAALATLAVKGRAPKTGYHRDQFGPAWSDVDRNGCDTRNDILRRDLTDIVIKTDTKGCVVASGTLDDPYTATTIFFVRGPNSGDVQIDHVVALSDAWQKGAQQWAADTRKAFANDPLNLLAVDGPTNASKGDGDAVTWLPPNKAYRCAYVARQIAVKTRYNPWVTSAEKQAMNTVLGACPDQKLPTNVSVPPPADSPTTPPTEPTTPPTDVYYANCDAVRAAGAAPLYAGNRATDRAWTSTATASPAKCHGGRASLRPDGARVGPRPSAQRWCAPAPEAGPARGA